MRCPAAVVLAHETDTSCTYVPDRLARHIGKATDISGQHGPRPMHTSNGPTRNLAALCRDGTKKIAMSEWKNHMHCFPFAVVAIRLLPAVGSEDDGVAAPWHAPHLSWRRLQRWRGAPR